MKVAILGGTFNPVHLGHLCLADDVRLTYGYDSIVFIPANILAHKDIEDDVTAGQRIDMLRAAVRAIPHFTVDACEIDRGGISYTIDTIRLLSAKYNVENKVENKLGVIIGDDLLEEFSKWKDPDRLSGLATLIVAHRYHTAKRPFSYPHQYVDNAIFPLSSSDIRNRVREGKSVQYLLPEAVWKYIEKNRLYQKTQELSTKTSKGVDVQR